LSFVSGRLLLPSVRHGLRGKSLHFNTTVSKAHQTSSPIGSAGLFQGLITMRSTIVLLLLFQASHGFAPPVLNGIHHRRRATAPATSLAATIGGPRHFDHDDHHGGRQQQALSSSMPALVKDCKLAMAGLAVGCMLVFSPTASLAAASPSGTDPTTWRRLCPACRVN
jgi:hypothetical protein